MMNFANLNIQKMKPYCPPLEGRSDYLCLDFNERTIGPPAKVLEVLSDFDLNVYPEYGDLVSRIAEYAEVSFDQVMITNGSDQGMDLIFRTFTERGDRVIIPTPSFVMYEQSAGMVGNEMLRPTYGPDGAFPLEDVLNLMDESIRLVVLCNPNNPTGTLIPLNDLERILKRALECDTLVYVDEAYFEFSKVTAAGLLDSYPNLVITRTFSKAFGIPSLRVGYVISNAMMINELLKVRGPYDVNMAGALAARASLDCLEEIERYVSEVMGEAKPMVEQFLKENDVAFFPSRANFLLIQPSDAMQAFEVLKENGILVRPRSGPNIENTLRVCVGTVSQMEQFIAVYRDCIL